MGINNSKDKPMLIIYLSRFTILLYFMIASTGLMMFAAYGILFGKYEDGSNYWSLIIGIFSFLSAMVTNTVIFKKDKIPEMPKLPYDNIPLPPFRDFNEKQNSLSSRSVSPKLGNTPSSHPNIDIEFESAESLGEIDIALKKKLQT